MTPCTAVRRMFHSTSGHERPLTARTQDFILWLTGCVEEPPHLEPDEAEEFLALLNTQVEGEELK